MTQTINQVASLGGFARWKNASAEDKSSHAKLMRGAKPKSYSLRLTERGGWKALHGCKVVLNFGNDSTAAIGWFKSKIDQRSAEQSQEANP